MIIGDSVYYQHPQRQILKKKFLIILTVKQIRCQSKMKRSQLMHVNTNDHDRLNMNAAKTQQHVTSSWGNHTWDIIADITALKLHQVYIVSGKSRTVVDTDTLLMSYCHPESALRSSLISAAFSRLPMSGLRIVQATLFELSHYYGSAVLVFGAWSYICINIQ